MIRTVVVLPENFNSRAKPGQLAKDENLKLRSINKQKMNCELLFLEKIFQHKVMLLGPFKLIDALFFSNEAPPSCASFALLAATTTL